MGFIGNLLWLMLGGLIMAVMFLFVGLLLCLTIIGIPFGLQLIKISRVMFWPFGKDVTTNFERHPIMNLLWLFTGGISSAMGHLIFAALFAVTIIGIPFAKQHMKLMKLNLIPFGATIN